MIMPKNPLAEVFGYPVGNMSPEAKRYRKGRWCPYNNPSGLTCTKSSATDPLGVCSIFDGDKIVITCPVRLRQDVTILEDATNFFFPDGKPITLTEVRLKDREGKAAGNIDIVLATIDENDKVTDFDSIEVQAVYISGNVRNVFKEYMKDPAQNYAMEWPSKNYPTPDYLSSSRKRLVPQLLYKGGILHSWHKKMAVVVHREFFEQLPHLEEVDEEEAEMAWMIYDFNYNQQIDRYELRRSDIKYTRFEDALATITTPTIGEMGDFVAYLEGRIKDKKLSGVPSASPAEPTIEPSIDSIDADTDEVN